MPHAGIIFRKSFGFRSNLSAFVRKNSGDVEKPSKISKTFESLNFGFQKLSAFVRNFYGDVEKHSNLSNNFRYTLKSPISLSTGFGFRNKGTP